MPPSITPQEFVAKWRRIELKERSVYQSHFIEICALVGHPTPTDIDPTGASEAELKKRTLTTLYNQRPTWLQNAHRKLDRAVFEAYGWGEELSDEEILERLLKLNLERATKQI